MKCEKCEFKRFHPGGDLLSIVNGCDDPYDYWYCAREHWEGEKPGRIDIKDDPWKNCLDFREVKNEM